jgi:hypothetical protein
MLIKMADRGSKSLQQMEFAAICYPSECKALMVIRSVVSRGLLT